MSQPTRKPRRSIAVEAGGDSSLAAQLSGLLERFRNGALDTEQSQRLIELLVAAEDSPAQPGPSREDEVRMLLQDLGGEIKKIEESLKVLNVYLTRIQKELRAPRGRVLH